MLFHSLLFFKGNLNSEQNSTPAQLCTLRPADVQLNLSLPFVLRVHERTCTCKLHLSLWIDSDGMQDHGGYITSSQVSGLL